MYHWSQYPEPKALQNLKSDVPPLTAEHLPLINGHLHTPYSFSAFSAPVEAIQLAKKENIKVVGVNDFNTVRGYQAWSDGCREHQLVPLFNIEMIGLNADDQAAGIKVNDPSNPGRTYISGKGLTTKSLPSSVATWLNKAVADNNEQSKAMTALMNQYLEKVKAPFTLNYDDISADLTLGQVRERHLARALRIKTDEYFTSEAGRLDFYTLLTGKKPAALDEAFIENMLRSALLKAGGPAFIPEDSSSFADLQTIRRLILDAGGVPTYPFLGDALKGQCTDFEESLPKTIRQLKERGFYSAEFITTRNSLEYLEQTAKELWANGFLVTFGTEHNTPAMEPLEPMASGSKKLTDTLMMINVQSVCILLAHQYLTEKTGEGWLDKTTGEPKLDEKPSFIETGWQLLNYKD
jgi:hypothetical protein